MLTLKVNDDKNDDDTNAAGDATVFSIAIYLLFTIYLRHFAGSFVHKDCTVNTLYNVPPSPE